MDQNKQHERDLESRQADMVSLALRLTADMAQEADILTLLRQGLELCTKVLHCERGLLIAQSSTGNMEIVEKSGNEDGSSYSTTAINLVREKKEPLLISDTIEDEQLNVSESICRNDIRSVLCTLLTAADEALFLNKEVFLYLDSRTDRHPLTLNDLDRFKLLSKLMSTLIGKSKLLQERDATIEELKNRMEQKRFDDLVFGSDAFRQCLGLIEQGAPADVPILLFGETGTGKERLARIIHDLSNRAEKNFLAVNCGAIPENLMESQLFGHEKGAFTGAVSARKGYFEEAGGGTLFLDEIGELPLAVQAQFLRALQEGEIMRVGSSKPIKVDVRIVAATNVDLEQAVEQARFRKDLFYRLNVFPVTIPSVRQRGEDALLLARFFLCLYSEKFGKRSLSLSKDSEKAILVYGWPGNVREIQNKVQRAVLTATGTVIGKTELGLGGASPNYTTLRQAREAVDREMVSYALERSPGNLTNAAKILDIDRKSLRLLVEKYGLKCEG